jgi:hypothetical protein
MGEDDEQVPDPAGKDRRTPTINVSASLGEAGHETKELGYEGVADEGAVLQEAGRKDAVETIDDALDAVSLPCTPD